LSKLCLGKPSGNGATPVVTILKWDRQ